MTSCISSSVPAAYLSVAFKVSSAWSYQPIVKRNTSAETIPINHAFGDGAELGEVPEEGEQLSVPDEPIYDG